MRFLLTLLALLSLLPAARAQTAFFDEVTDTIQIDSGALIQGTCTYEAILFFPSDIGDGGMIYNEWTSGSEDKFLQVYFSATGPSTLVGYNFPAASIFAPTADVAADTWHHVAFVCDGSEERFYLDGVLVEARAQTTPIGDGIGSGFIGAIPRDGTISGSFRGYLDALRLSDVARYTGDTYTPTYGDFESDDDTVLLFNFNEPEGSVTVADESAFGRTGTLGAGFEGATPPTLSGRPVANEPGTEVASGADLAVAYPNPFASQTTLRYSLDAPGPVRLTVHDVLGRTVAVLAEGTHAAGTHTTVLNGRDLAAGLYLARLSVLGHGVRTRRLMRLR